MAEKDGVFLVEDRSAGRIVGFSTMKTLDMQMGNKTVKGVFSGDTIIEEQYWGNKALHVAFFLRMIREKLRHPFRPMFWLLISKGYKTYLLMANNFLNYYPNPEKHCDKLEGLVDNYCEMLFEPYYCPKNKLLDFGGDYTHLKSGVAQITDEMRASNEKIHFFEKRNATWQRGTELPCVGEVSYSLILNYPFTLLRKMRRKSRLPMTAMPAK
ncbi:hypothetical protein MWU49_04625 [Alcanivorax sp. S6407]|uniref:hypothetical protein n=1 Tax=Alcanivorax sp. S6407 TaxID=2926424 RepID=UPI001FF454D5|nr:hypothetical protein [Alcanivorax sp. S6407]MCK0152977.1 hypothetical protein [Alcanivorax sp. S6407]